MIKDHYSISSNFRPKKKASQCNVKEFFEMFEDYYTKVLMRKTPDLPHKMCDPYGFALLCEDYKPIMGRTKHNENSSCHDSFLNIWDTPFDSLYKFKFPFKILLDLFISNWSLFNFIFLANSSDKTTHSKRELLASLLAPCKEVQLTSPEVKRFSI